MSGFETDPMFDIIMMPEADEQAATGEQESEEDLDAQDGTDRNEQHMNGQDGTDRAE